MWILNDGCESAGLPEDRPSPSLIIIPSNMTYTRESMQDMDMVWSLLLPCDVALCLIEMDDSDEGSYSMGIVELEEQSEMTMDRERTRGNEREREREGGGEIERKKELVYFRIDAIHQ